jgi:transcription antitermination factor NusG
MKMVKPPPTDTGFKVGDRVRLVSGTLTWKSEFALQGKIGEVTECRDDGRLTIRFDGGRLLVGRDAEHLERPVELGLKAKK